MPHLQHNIFNLIQNKHHLCLESWIVTLNWVVVSCLVSRLKCWWHVDSWTGLLSKTVTSESVRGGCVTGHRRHGALSEPETLGWDTGWRHNPSDHRTHNCGYIFFYLKMVHYYFNNTIVFGSLRMNCFMDGLLYNLIY